MKNLKLILVVAIAFFSMQATAQTFGIKAGLNLANMNFQDDDGEYNDDNKMKMGFHLGATVAFPISDALSFETGLLLSTKGVKSEETYDSGAGTVTVEGKTNLMYLDIPLDLKYAYDMGSAKIYGTFGPYIGMALSGTWEYTDGTDTESGDLKIGSETYDAAAGTDGDDIKMLDFGLSFGAGVQFGQISVGASYALGLANLSPNTEGGNKMNNKVIGISLGYSFGGE